MILKVISETELQNCGRTPALVGWLQLAQLFTRVRTILYHILSIKFSMDIGFRERFEICVRDCTASS